MKRKSTSSVSNEDLLNSLKEEFRTLKVADSAAGSVSKEDLIAMLKQITFVVESAAHLRNLEHEILPIADKARELIAKAESCKDGVSTPENSVEKELATIFTQGPSAPFLTLFMQYDPIVGRKYIEVIWGSQVIGIIRVVQPEQRYLANCTHHRGTGEVATGVFCKCLDAAVSHIVAAYLGYL